MSKVQIVSQSDSRLTLEQAVLLYKANNGDVYATVHGIEPDANQPNRRMIGAGVALTKNNLSDFARAVHASTAYADFIPHNLLYTSPSLLAWWVPEAIRTTWFKCTETEIGTAHGPAAHPALVFVAARGTWFVFALAESVRPRPDTQLQHAPHFNVWERGEICTGNVALPAALTAGALGSYEDAFFRSHFTHPNRKDAVNYPGDLLALWSDQLKKPDAEKMRAALKPAGETLQAAIKRISTTTR